MNEETRNCIEYIAQWMDDRGQDAESMRATIGHKINRDDLETKVQVQYTGRQGTGFCAHVSVVYHVAEWCRIKFESWVDPEEGLTGKVSKDEPSLPRVMIDDYRKFPV